MYKKIFILAISTLFLLQFSAQADNEKGECLSQTEAILVADENQVPCKLSLDQCLDIALKRNRRRNVSALAVKIAEYQHSQSLSAYWPGLLLNSSYSRLDEDLNFIFPEETSNYTITGVGPGPIDAIVHVPEKTVKVLDRDIGLTSLELTVPIFTGGTRRAIVNQAKFGVEATKQAARRTDLQVIYDVKRMYYGAVLSRLLHRIGEEILLRLNATLELTERLYKEGSGTVTKADYLRNKVILESIRSAVVGLESNREISKAALLNTMGLSWDADYDILETEIPFNSYSMDLELLVSNSYVFNPDWRQLLEGLKVAKEKIKEEKGGRWPKIALSGTLWKLGSPYDEGFSSKENQNGWKVGLGIQIPIFNGFLTTNRIREASTRLEKMQEEQILLREGIALQIKNIFLKMLGYKKQLAAVGEAVRNAEENLELNVRAYHAELVEVRDVIEAQLMESFMKALYQKALYNHAQAQFNIDFIVGCEVRGLLE